MVLLFNASAIALLKHLAWMHVPKTSGYTTYINEFRALHGHFALFPTKTSNFPDDCGTKHFWHCTHSELHECAARAFGSELFAWLTIFRDPVERVLSEYHFYSGKRSYYGWTDEMKASRHDLVQWIHAENNTAHNKQAMYVLFDMPYPSEQSLGCAPMQDHDKTQGWMQSHGATFRSFNEDPRFATQAIRRLESAFVFVFLYNRMEESKRLFERIFGTSTPAMSLRRKTHPSRRTRYVPADVVRAIRERNRVDYAIVDHIEARMRARNHPT